MKAFLFPPPTSSAFLHPALPCLSPRRLRVSTVSGPRLLPHRPTMSFVAPSTTPAPAARTALARKYGRWAVVTGASSGIGAEFARQLAVAGLSLILVARRAARLSSLASTLRSTCGVEVVVVAVDLTSTDAVDEIMRACGGREVGLLVNNAGVELHGSMFRHGFADHRRLLMVNVVAATEVAHALGRRFCEQGRGGMVFVSSVTAGGAPWFATYSASKAYLTTLALMMREEVGKKGVDVLALEPGLVVSEMTVEEGAEEVPGFLMPAEECVREGLEMLGRKAVWTPGWKNRVYKTVFGMLPRTWTFRIVGEWFGSKMEAELFEYEAAESKAE